MKILRFKLFEEVDSKSKTYSADQFDQFCDDVLNWCEENDTKCMWCLFGYPDNSEGFGWKKKDSKRFWDMYVKGDKQFTTCEMDDTLIGILHTDDKIEMAFDNMDNKINPSDVQDCI